MSDDTFLREEQRRLRKLMEQQTRSGIDTRPQIETEIEDLEAATPRSPRSARGAMGCRTATSRRWTRPSGC